MAFDRRSMWTHSQTLRGCLTHLRTTKGRRRYPDREDPFRMPDPFVSDEAKLLSSKAYRTLGQKTQVFTLPQNALIRTRLAHVLEVVATTVVASEMLGLNTNLARAAALGHDIGHVPFGHQGEAWMAKQMGKSFCHEIMAPIVTQRIERAGRGLNLTFETLEAMMRHSGNTAKEGMSQEAWVLRHTDKFTYIFHDINDIGRRARYPLSREVVALADLFGSTQRERVSTALSAFIIESAEMGKVSFEQSEPAVKFKRLRNLMYELYPKVTQQNVHPAMSSTLEFLEMLGLGDPYLLLALMTDQEVTRVTSQTMRDANLFSQMGIGEIAPNLAAIGMVDLCDPGLDW
jgi:dGTP triphosphohydrolase